VSFCEQLRSIRRYKDIKQEDLAKDLGISCMGLSYLERGEREIKLDFLIKWAGRLGLKVNINLEPFT
jgi:transcriptional regulator with XRE-family HTH domain